MNRTILAAEIASFYNQTFAQSMQANRSIALCEHSSLDDIEASGIFSQISDRQDYQRWVNAYKVWIKAMEAYIHALRAESHGDALLMARAQSCRHYAAQNVTRAILLRRLCRRWSAAQRQRLASAAA